MLEIVAHLSNMVIIILIRYWVPLPEKVDWATHASFCRSSTFIPPHFLSSFPSAPASLVSLSTSPFMLLALISFSSRVCLPRCSISRSRATFFCVSYVLIIASVTTFCMVRETKGLVGPSGGRVAYGFDLL